MLRTLNFIATSPLNKSRKLSALLGFAKWQIVSRLHKGKLVIDWIDDARLIVGNGETGLTGNIYSGLMEFDDMAFILCALRPSDLFLDVGANVGAYTVLASKICGAPSVSFEPVPSTFNRLQDQIRLNRIEAKVTSMNVGVGDVTGAIKFTADLDTTNKVAAVDYLGDVVEVNVVTLDDKVFDCAGKVFIKIDVEGFEMNVLRGGEKLLRDPRSEAVILELNGSGQAYGFCDDDIHAKMLSFGFVAVQFDGEKRTFKLAKTFNAGGNTIYVKDLDAVKKRCLEGAARVVHTVGGKMI